MPGVFSRAEAPTVRANYLTHCEIKRYLPYFDPEYDPQVGDWVMVTPPRRAILLNPLIAIWERQPARSNSDGAAFSSSATPRDEHTRRSDVPVRYPLSGFACFASAMGGAALGTTMPQLAPLSTAKAIYCPRKRQRSTVSSTDDCDSCLSETINQADPVLYLHIRLGLLTPSTPAIFGGSDCVEALVIRSAWQSPEFEIVQLYAGDATQGLHVHMPEWCASAEEEAKEELAAWQKKRFFCHFATNT